MCPSPKFLCGLDGAIMDCLSIPDRVSSEDKKTGDVCAALQNSEKAHHFHGPCWLWFVVAHNRLLSG